MHVALQALVGIAVAALGAYGVIFTARTARSTTEHQSTIDGAVQRDQNAIEGFDRLTHRLETEVQQLRADVAASRAETQQLRAEVNELRGENAIAQKWRSTAVDFIRLLLADLEQVGAPKRPVPPELDL